MKLNNLFFKGSDLNRERLPKIDSQMHTNWTDGKHSVREMVEYAKKIGMQCILFSEHTSAKSDIWFPKFSEEIRAERNKNNSIEILIGTETKCINQNGEIFIHPEVEKRCDLIMGVVHRMPRESHKFYEFDEINGKQALELEYEITLNLLRNKKIDILGHAMGMTIERYGVIPSTEVLKNIVQECLKNSIVFEINSKYHYKIIDKLISILCKSDAYFTLGSDAHNKIEIGNCWTLFEESRMK